jgi:hypothetical protein
VNHRGFIHRTVPDAQRCSGKHMARPSTGKNLDASVVSIENGATIGCVAKRGMPVGKGCVRRPATIPTHPPV